MLVGEGQSFTLPTQTADTVGLLGNVSAEIAWGDGTTDQVDLPDFSSPTSLRVRFDYTYDTSNFFTNARRALLQDIADSIVQYFGDQLSAITPSGTNTWNPMICHPSAGAPTQLCGPLTSVANQMPSVAANEIVIFPGARDLTGNVRGVAGVGVASISGSQAWINTVSGRGQSGALASPQTDFSLWGGSLTLDNNGTDWYFGRDPNGIQDGQADFVTIAAHELMHVFGFGYEPTTITSAWENLTRGSVFVGQQATAAYPLAGFPPLQAAGATRQHWDSTLEDNGVLTLMRASLSNGERQILSRLDLAALDDIGWQVTYPSQAVVSASHVYPDDGNYDIDVKVTGSRLGESGKQLSEQVTNVSPTLTVPSTQSVTLGNTLSLPSNSFVISDPGFRNTLVAPPTNETFTYSINWGDGSAEVTGNAVTTQNGNASLPTLAAFGGNHVYGDIGSYTVTVSVADDDGGQATQSFRVNVDEAPALSLSLSVDTAREDAGESVSQLTVERAGPISESQMVTINTSDSTEAVVDGLAQSTITIPANSRSVTVPISVIDDQLLDGTQTVTFTATATGFQSTQITMDVEDAEQLLITASSLNFIEGRVSGILVVRRSNTNLDAEVMVNISGGNDSQLSVPANLSIPSGTRQVSFFPEPVDDATTEDAERLTYTFQANGYDDSTITIELLDDEQPYFQYEPNSFDVDTLNGVTALDALLIINFVARRGGPSTLPWNPQEFASVQRQGLYYDVNGDYSATALDALLVINQVARQGTSSLQSQPEGLSFGLATLDDSETDDPDWLALLAEDRTTLI